MGMGKQAKIINEHQLQALLAWLGTRKHATRNRLIVLLSFKAGLRAKEIASKSWGFSALGHLWSALAATFAHCAVHVSKRKLPARTRYKSFFTVLTFPPRGISRARASPYRCWVVAGRHSYFSRLKL